MAEMPKSAAQQSAEAQAFLAAQSYFGHRSQMQTLMSARAGRCMADGLQLYQQQLNGDFELDEPLLQRLLQGGSLGAVIRAAPAPRRAPAPAPAGSSALSTYLSPPLSASKPFSTERLNEEIAGAVYGPGNVLANSSAALSGALRGVAGLDLAAGLRKGIEALLSGSTNKVSLSPNLELYNTARVGRKPVVRLRVIGLPMTVVKQSIPALGGAQNQWRGNSSRNAMTLPTRNMTAQQMRNTALLAAEHGQPGWLRWTQGRVGGGVLTFAPSAALDIYNNASVDLAAGKFGFNGRQFMVDSARSQSGNLVGFAGGLFAVAVFGGMVAGAPLVLVGLVGGIVVQALWNYSGAADGAVNLTQKALR